LEREHFAKIIYGKLLIADMGPLEQQQQKTKKKKRKKLKQDNNRIINRCSKARRLEYIHFTTYEKH